MAEYLSVNGHERSKVYEYSLKKIFYYFDVADKNEQKRLYDNCVNMNMALLGANSEEGHKAFQSHLSNLMNN